MNGSVLSSEEAQPKDEGRAGNVHNQRGPFSLLHNCWSQFSFMQYFKIPLNGSFPREVFSAQEGSNQFCYPQASICTTHHMFLFLAWWPVLSSKLFRTTRVYLKTANSFQNRFIQEKHGYKGKSCSKSYDHPQTNGNRF